MKILESDERYKDKKPIKQKRAARLFLLCLFSLLLLINNPIGLNNS